MRWQYDPKEIRSGPMQERYEGERPLSRLRCERLRRGWSQLELAEKVRATKVSVSRWENEKVIPQPSYCRRLSEVLEIGLVELFPEGPKRVHTDKIHSIASIRPTQTNNLKQARLQRGLTQMELAEVVGTTRGSVNRWECGLGSPNLHNLRKLCQFLRVSPEELFPDTISEPGAPTQEEAGKKPFTVTPLSTLEEAKETGTRFSTSHSTGQRFFDY